MTPNKVKEERVFKRIQKMFHVHSFWENEDQCGVYELEFNGYKDKQYLTQLECKCGLKYLTIKEYPVIIR